ncbi:bifunctional glycosyltransferase family 2 protein/CDP-glycerol:glycerophosphate glycerophosphotransferase [Scandinavium manionii]|uniref:bifunctional glycosyltransferase family 2 protein/CDP-glycerol:glycerophosphate glycerophosphotransferase n=1 Tax=Scandinavium manionii TaxID=2926520 RepID=UPI002166943C|nr:bifunctional glycosyltransferase family 2 protein/CDP-glycerol:glycerophosphate glycerophosphotransferase [Scandinavium manionii]MCS2150707.1 bifunctional glycosyltransferase family 2 protein/CDP-glycerol:glycerophosphate glycerophosphotransferase [Scandinavium manionii]
MSLPPTPNKNPLLMVKTLDSGRELPFVSVVTPTWNRAAFLPYLLYMFRYQDYPADRRELVILDDSPQSNEKIIHALTQGKPEAFNIRYVHSPERLDLGRKRNMLNELAQGEYIVCMDDDDYYPRDKIAYTIGMMQRHRALISGSDQIAIWYSHINRIFKTRSFGENHILNGTFCYHRNYLKKHRYEDDCNLAEEKGFTNNFTVKPLQLPAERTILCISHSQNTFDKDFVLGSSQALETTLDEWVSDPMLKTWYHGLHNAAHGQSLDWRHVDQFVVINLDKREDRLQHMRNELSLLGVPAEKITRMSAVEDRHGQSGRRQSHLQALQLAQEKGWKNYLLLEDDAVMLKQAKHVQALKKLLHALPVLPWEVILLGASVQTGSELKSFDNLVRASSCDHICAYLVNSPSYATLLRQMQEDLSTTLEEQWQPLLRQGKWLAFYPSIAYQKPGLSDITGEYSDMTQHYFSRLPRNTDSMTNAAPVEKMLNQTIGFFMESAFHYQVYKPILDVLLAQGYQCELLINDRTPKEFIHEMQECLSSLDTPQLHGSLLSKVAERRQKYGCLVSPYYSPVINGLAEVHVRAMYGLAKEEWNHAWWNTFYQHILCYSHHSQQALNINGSAVLVGNPRFDAWHNQQFEQELPASLRIDPAKPTLLYAPTYGALSSIPHWVEKLHNLSHQYNVITKLHHGTLCRAEEKTSLSLVKRYLKRHVSEHQHTLALLEKADFVITDNSGFIFDAIHAGKRTILLNWEGMDDLLKDGASYSTAHSADQKIREILPGAGNIETLVSLLKEETRWSEVDKAMQECREYYCDAFLDGQAAARAAKVITNALEQSSMPGNNTLLASIQKKLFS